MVKVLVADENLETNLGCCNYLANDKELNISNVFNGLNVINKYYEDNPNVLVINSDFKDNWRPSGGSDIACGSSGSGAGSIPGKRESAG